jgi:hypothetical protein
MNGWHKKTSPAFPVACAAVMHSVDDPRPVIRTLERTASPGNFEYLVAAG